MLPHPSEHSTSLTHITCTKALLKPDSLFPKDLTTTLARGRGHYYFSLSRQASESEGAHWLGVGWDFNPGSLTAELHFPSPYARV